MIESLRNRLRLLPARSTLRAYGASGTPASRCPSPGLPTGPARPTARRAPGAAPPATRRASGAVHSASADVASRGPRRSDSPTNAAVPAADSSTGATLTAANRAPTGSACRAGARRSTPRRRAEQRIARPRLFRWVAREGLEKLDDVVHLAVGQAEGPNSWRLHPRVRTGRATTAVVVPHDVTQRLELPRVKV